MATQRHGDTEARVEGFEARLQAGFEWVADHPRHVLSVLGAMLLLGLAVAVAYEWRSRTRDQASRELARIEAQFAEAMGGDRRLALVPEPANAEQAARSREAALESLEEFIGRSRGRPVELAAVRAAELELDLGRLEAADARLRGVVEGLAASDPLRGIALRLLAVALEEASRPREAGDAFAQAAETEAYPDPGALWLSAAEAYRRAGETELAAAAYRHVIDADPAYAGAQRVEDRLVLLELESPPAPPGGALEGEPGGS